MTYRAPTFLAAALAITFVSAEAAAQERPLRQLCVDRPGKDTPACTVDRGHALIELGAFGHRRGPGAEDEYAIGALLARYGVTDNAELQLSFNPYNFVHSFDLMGRRQSLEGAGDLTVAMRRNFLNPDGSGLSVAGQIFVTAPTGTDGIGAGSWEGGIIIPVSFELSDVLNLTIDPELDIKANESGGEHHFAYVGVVSISRDLGSGVTGSAEIWSMVDRDPDQHTTEASFDVMLAWAPKRHENLQFDVEVDLGLTHATSAVEIQAGATARF